MKGIMGWLQQRQQPTFTAPDPSAVAELKEVCLSGGTQLLGVDLVTRQYYGDYKH